MPRPENTLHTPVRGVHPQNARMNYYLSRVPTIQQIGLLEALGKASIENG